MGDADLLVFGCGVSFIVAAGFYVYLRECFTGVDESENSGAEEQSSQDDLRDVA